MSDPVLSHPEVLAMGWLPAGLLRVAPDGSTVRTDGGDAYSEHVEVLLEKGSYLDLDDEVTAAWAAGYCLASDTAYPRAAVLGHTLGRVRAPEGVVCHRLHDADGGLVEALDSDGAQLAAWRVDLAQPDSVSRQ
tara:strand:- start:45 stop:446 length:402 start_codon:yes stop_codon:yes gene_type:complete